MPSFERIRIGGKTRWVVNFGASPATHLLFGECRHSPQWPSAKAIFGAAQQSAKWT